MQKKSQKVFVMFILNLSPYLSFLILSQYFILNDLLRIFSKNYQKFLKIRHDNFLCYSLPISRLGFDPVNCQILKLSSPSAGILQFVISFVMSSVMCHFKWKQLSVFFDKILSNIEVQVSQQGIIILIRRYYMTEITKRR